MPNTNNYFAALRQARKSNRSRSNDVPPTPDPTSQPSSAVQRSSAPEAPDSCPDTRPGTSQSGSQPEMPEGPFVNNVGFRSQHFRVDDLPLDMLTEKPRKPWEIGPDGYCLLNFWSYPIRRRRKNQPKRAKKDKAPKKPRKASSTKAKTKTPPPAPAPSV